MAYFKPKKNLKFSSPFKKNCANRLLEQMPLFDNLLKLAYATP